MPRFRYFPILLMIMANAIFFSCTRQSHKKNVMSKYRHKNFNPSHQCFHNDQDDIYGTVTIGLGGTPLYVKGFSPSVSYQYQQIDANTKQITNGIYKDSIKVNAHSSYTSMLVLGVEVGNKGSLFAEANGGWMKGQGNNLFINVGVGYNITIPDQNIIVFRPSVGFAYAETDLTFNNFINNYYKDVKILGSTFNYKYVHSTKNSHYTEYVKTVNTKLLSYQGGMKLKMGFGFFPESQFVTRLNVGYFIPMFQDIRVKVYSDANSQSIDYNNPDLHYKSHNNPISDQSFQYGGFFWNIEIGVRF